MRANQGMCRSVTEWCDRRQSFDLGLFEFVKRFIKLPLVGLMKQRAFTEFEDLVWVVASVV